MLITASSLALAAALAFAIGMGASGTAPSMSAAFGARLIRPRAIPAFFGIMVFVGALLAGGRVRKTLSGGIIPEEFLKGEWVVAILCVCAVTLLLSTLVKVPQSTSQATVASLVGVGLVRGGVHWEGIATLIPMWFVLPAISFGLSYLVGTAATYRARSAVMHMERGRRYKALRVLVLCSSAWVAFAIGSNNVANATAPLVSAGILSPVVGIVLISPYFGIGSSFLGQRVLGTVARDILKMGLLSAVWVACITGTLLLAASLLGIPQSLVQLNAGAILGLACARSGARSVMGNPMVRRLVWTWTLAPLLALGLSVAIGNALIRFSN